MKQRSSNNWETKSGSWDSLNTEQLINIKEIMPTKSSDIVTGKQIGRAHV